MTSFAQNGKQLRMKVHENKIYTLAEQSLSNKIQSAMLIRIFGTINEWLKLRMSQRKTTRKEVMFGLPSGPHIAILYTTQLAFCKPHRVTIALGKYLLHDGIVVKKIEGLNLNFDHPLSSN